MIYVFGELMLNIALVDDEKLLLDYVESIILESFELSTFSFKLTKYLSINEILKKQKNYEIDIAILDIHLSDGNGIELSKVLYKLNKNIIFIFLTSSEEYMKDAFGLNVYRYILKSEMDNVLPITLKSIIELKIKQNHYFTYMANNKTFKIDYDNIICFEKINRKIYLTTTKDVFILTSQITLKEIDNQLSKHLFIYANSGTIINVEHIHFISKDTIKMNHKSEDIFLSRGKYQAIYDMHTSKLMRGDLL